MKQPKTAIQVTSQNLPLRRGQAVFALILTLWAIIGLVGVFAIRRVGTLQSETELVGTGAARLAQAVADIDQGQLKNSMRLKACLGLVPVNETSQLVHDNETREQGFSFYMEEQEQAIDRLTQLVADLLNEQAGPDHLAAVENVLHDVQKLKAKFRAYSDLIRPVVGTKDLSSTPVITQNFISATDREDTELDLLIDEVAAGVNRLIDESIQASSRYQRLTLRQIVWVIVLASIVGLVLVVAIRAMQVRLQKAESLALIGKMTIALHHEINNPLAVIVGNAYLLRQKDLSEEQHSEAIRVIQEMAQEISSVLKKLGDLKEIVTREYLAGEEMLDLS